MASLLDLPQYLVHRILLAADARTLRTLGRIARVSTACSAVAGPSFKERARVRFPSVELLVSSSTGNDDGINWGQVYRRHAALDTRTLQGQRHAPPPMSRRPQHGFDEFVVIVEAFTGNHAGGTYSTAHIDMSTARSLGAVRARPVFRGSHVEFHAEFDDEPFAPEANFHGGFIRVLVARACAPHKIHVLYEGIFVDADYHKPRTETHAYCWGILSPAPVFSIACSCFQSKITDPRFHLDEPIVNISYYANSVRDTLGDGHGRCPYPACTKELGSSILLTFCDSEAYPDISPEPTADEILFRLDHFLVYD